MISCSNLYQDLTSTTVELTPEFISHVRNTTTGDNNYIFAKLTCGRKTITKKIDISEQTAANGAVLTFDNLIVGKKGSVYIAVANDETVEDFKSETIASIEGTTNFTVQPNNQTKIKVTLNPATKYTAYFTTFTESPNGTTPSYPVITFTQNSTITAPLPVGTTRWQIYFNNLSKISYHGGFGEEIDVAKDLIQYKEYFKNLETGNNDTVYFEATGNPMNQIKTPIVYSFSDSDSETPYLYNFANSLDEVGENTKSLFDSSSEIKDYCFDNAGNFYFIKNDQAYKIAYNHKENKYEDYTEDYAFLETAKDIMYDKTKNFLYDLSENMNQSIVLTKFENPAGTIFKSEYNNCSQISLDYSLFYPDNDSSTYLDYNWNIDNNTLYLTRMQQISDWYVTPPEHTYKLVIKSYNLDDLENQETQTAEYTIPSNTSISLSGTIDTMFQDGSLYIIFSCSNPNWDGSKGENRYYNYSTGGIVKYNTEFGQFDESFGIKGFVDTSNTITNIGTSNSDVYYYAPTSGNNGTESKYFYGPKQFVAIMPKKLVFLDSGADVSSYAYDADNKRYIPSKSRIVEYDLSTNSFSSTEITGTDLGFNFSGSNISF